MRPAMQPRWRLLGAFWAGVIVLAGAGLGTLAALGPPALPTSPTITVASAPAETPPSIALPTTAPPAIAPAQAPPLAQAAAPAAAQAAAQAAAPAAAQPAAHTAAPPSPAPASVPVPAPAPTVVASPDAALLTPATPNNPARLPQIAADGRMPRQVYAAPQVQAPPGVPRVALLMSGFGLAERDSRSAIEQLPGPVSFAVSAYAINDAALLDAARHAGHELLASIPMEPQGYPQNDEGAHSLLTGANPDENRRNLDFALSQTLGAVGATGASDGLRGERFADIPAAYAPVVDDVTRRGLLYVDARPGRAEPPGAPVRSIDVVLDERLGRAEIDARLNALERVAKERGSAIGLAGPLRPTTIERIAAWARAVQSRGLVLVPVSQVVNP